MTGKARSAYIGLCLVTFLTPWLILLTGKGDFVPVVFLMLLLALFVFTIVMVCMRQRIAFAGVAWLLLIFLSTMIIPGIGSISPERIEARYKRTAQGIVGVYLAGAKAGVIWTGKTRNARIDAVCNGQAPPDRASSDERFRLPLVPGEEITKAYKFIGMDANGDLFYDATGGQSDS